MMHEPICWTGQRASAVPIFLPLTRWTLIVHQARGSPRSLLSIASLAFFTAAWGGATQIGVRHVAYWLKSEFVEDSAAPHGEVLAS